MNSDKAKTHVLVVDDEEMVAGSIERTLRTFDLSVTVATSGVEALNIARRHKPDIMVLDVLMPGMDGLEVCREVRADPILYDLPIIFLTARAKMEDKLVGFRQGADDYIAKPFNAEELVLRIHAILRRGVSKPMMEAVTTRLVIRDLTLDCKAFKAITPRVTITLTPVQFDLLYFLMSHPGEVFSPTKLLHDVWDYPFDAGSPDLVRVHVKNIREKIEEHPSKPVYVETVAGHGYTVNP